MIDPSFAQKRLAIYHRAMEAKNQGRDRLACSLMHEAVGDMLVLPKASPGREQYWWDTYIAAADEVYSELSRACELDRVKAVIEHVQEIGEYVEGDWDPDSLIGRIKGLEQLL